MWFKTANTPEPTHDGEPVGNVRDFVGYFLFPLAIAVGIGVAIDIAFHRYLLNNC
jgi:hypothetical protein